MISLYADKMIQSISSNEKIMTYSGTLTEWNKKYAEIT